jgi:hypothetical protein
LAQEAGVTSIASTEKPIGSIEASGSVLARVRGAFVDVRLAERARITTHTITRKAVQGIETDAVVQTRVGSTFVDVRLTLST